MLSVWLQFCVCASLIGFAGTRLSHYGDVIADKTGLSGNWIGMILLATVTSLPELVTGISSVGLANAPDIAVGNVLGSRMAEVMGWHSSFVGTLFIAATTTLPELVVTISALRIGALDMAIANLLGSNLFNITILAIDDLFYLKGPLFAHVAPVHVLSALSATVMTGLATAGLIFRPGMRVLRSVGWISIGLIVMYFLNSYVLFQQG